MDQWKWQIKREYNFYSPPLSDDVISNIFFINLYTWLFWSHFRKWCYCMCNSYTIKVTNLFFYCKKCNGANKEPWIIGNAPNKDYMNYSRWVLTASAIEKYPLTKFNSKVIMMFWNISLHEIHFSTNGVYKVPVLHCIQSKFSPKL